MKKFQVNALIMDSLKSSGLDYKVLNYLNGLPQHVRVEGVCDVYPSTGTWCGIDKSYRKNDVNGFILLILDSDKPKTLEQRLTDLEEYVAHLEMKIEDLS
jgi:hypothetical protein